MASTRCCVRLLHYSQYVASVSCGNPAKVASAIGTGDPQLIALAKLERTTHHNQTRGERLEYYKKRQTAMEKPDDCPLMAHLNRTRSPRSQHSIQPVPTLASADVSLILDKWDSAKSTCPYFQRSTLRGVRNLPPRHGGSADRSRSSAVTARSFLVGSCEA